MELLEIAIVGAGAMGAGIAQVAARAGHRVLLYDQRPEAAARAIAGIGQQLEKLVARGKLSPETAAGITARITALPNLNPIASAGLVIEAIVEDLAAKQALLAEIEGRVSPACLLATNTSSLSIPALARALRSPERLAGMHFFNPAPLMQLVEIVGGVATDPAVLTALGDLARAWGKTPVQVRSSPGFIVNRVARPFYAEGLRLVAEQAAAPATIDAVVREAGGFRMGPLELTDLIGQDVNFAVTTSVFRSFFGDPRFTPSLVQQELVEAGWLGRKTGRGFYPYGEGAAPPLAQTAVAAPAPRRLAVIASEPLLRRLEGHGVEIVRDPHLPAELVLRESDGRTARACEAAGDRPQPTAVVDMALDYAAATRTAVAFSPACQPSHRQAVVGTLQAAGLAVSEVRDLPGLILLRTVAMLINEACDAVHYGVASREDVDTAMRLGVNYPLGPFAWLEQLGRVRVRSALRHLAAFYGEDRYRLSPGLHG